MNYPAGQPLPGPAALAGKAIVVCTYDKLFNAKSTFDRDDVMLTPCALVLDDAHTGIELVRDSFTLRVEAGELYDSLIAILAPACREHHAGQWAAIERADGSENLEVPFWVWADHLEKVREPLERVGSAPPNVFVWGYMRDHLRWCRCVVSGSALEIFYDTPPVQLARPFFEATHRVYMSATLSDDSALVRNFGCSTDAAESPIVPSADGGVGERMVLAPFLVDPSLDRNWVMDWCANQAKRVRVAVLASSEARAREWEDRGALVELGDGVATTVASLRAGTVVFAAFAQRYDGVDLPDDACRILVIDGMPSGQGLAEEHDRTIPGRPGGALRRMAYRIEQGIGRAVRSEADYAVVVLAGPELSNFLAKNDVLELLGSATRAQLALGEELVRMAEVSGESPAEAVADMANKCIARDSGWRSYYDTKVRELAQQSPPMAGKSETQLAEAEHLAQKAALARNTTGAADLLTKAINDVKPTEAQVGWLLQRKANYLYAMNPGEAMQVQVAAHEKNQRLSTPPKGVNVRPPEQTGKVASALILSWYSEFKNANGAVAELATLKTQLGFESSPNALEQALCDVAKVFGATGTRPEKTNRRGPDNLWVWPQFAWVIETKNERSILPKSDGGQLLAAMQWFQECYPEHEAIPIVVAKVSACEHDAFFPQGTRVMNPTGLAKLVENLVGLTAELAKQPPLFWKTSTVNGLLQNFRLAAPQFSGEYTKPLTRKQR